MNQPWYNVALQVWGAIALGIPLLIWLLNKGRKQAVANVSKTEGEVYKNIIETKLAEVNITEIIEKKVEHEIQPLKEMLWNREKEHYEVKSEMQKRLQNELQEKEILVRENNMLHDEIAEIRKEYSILQLQFGKLQKEVDKLKLDKNGK